MEGGCWWDGWVCLGRSSREWSENTPEHGFAGSLACSHSCVVSTPVQPCSRTPTQPHDHTSTHPHPRSRKLTHPHTLILPHTHTITQPRNCTPAHPHTRGISSQPEHCALIRARTLRCLVHLHQRSREGVTERAANTAGDCPHTGTDWNQLESNWNHHPGSPRITLHHQDHPRISLHHLD